MMFFVGLIKGCFFKSFFNCFLIFFVNWFCLEISFGLLYFDDGWLLMGDDIVEEIVDEFVEIDFNFIFFSWGYCDDIFDVFENFLIVGSVLCWSWFLLIWRFFVVFLSVLLLCFWCVFEEIVGSFLEIFFIEVGI